MGTFASLMVYRYRHMHAFMKHICTAYMLTYTCASVSVYYVGMYVYKYVYVFPFPQEQVSIIQCVVPFLGIQQFFYLLPMELGISLRLRQPVSFCRI